MERRVQIDYHTPRFTFKEAAIASGFKLNTLRSYFQSGTFRILGQRGSRGIPSLLNLHDIFTIAVANRLRELGIEPVPAFEAGIVFSHSSHGARLPARLYDPREGYTVLVFRAGSRRADVLQMGSGDTLDFAALFFDRVTGLRAPCAVLLLNDLEREVFAALGPTLHAATSEVEER